MRHMVRWTLLLLLLATVGCGTVLTSSSAKTRLDYDWECQPKDAMRPTPMTCTFRGLSGSGFVCGEVVVVCGTQRHVAKLCSGMLSPNQERKHAVLKVLPAVSDPEQCTKIRFEQKLIH